jgi:RNA-directed DNA polymerase
LAIGAPTSPILSNILMFDLDKQLSSYASENGYVYTRYADDITFSAQGEIVFDATFNAVRDALLESKFDHLRLNRMKTRLVSNNRRRQVTGLIITPNHKVSLGLDRKRLISSMVHHFCFDRLSSEDRLRLAGLVAFAQDVEPSFTQTLRRKYGPGVISSLLNSR